MNTKIILPIAFLLSLCILAAAVFMVVKTRNLPHSTPSDMMSSMEPDMNNQTTIDPKILQPTTVPIMKNEIVLVIDTPLNGSTVSENSVVIQGTTASKAEVFVNDATAIADINGKFSVTVELDEGENPIIIVVNDSMGNTAEAEMKVTYDSGTESN